MSLPVHLHSGMTGAPSLSAANGSINALLNACLVNGFNTQSVVSATASGGVVTLNFASAPGFSALDTVVVAGSTGGTADGRFRVQSAAGNQVLLPVPGIADGAVGGTITCRFAPLGWTRPFNGAGVGAYRQGGSSGTKRYLRVFDNTLASDAGFYLRGYETMSGASAGTGPFPTASQVSGAGVNFIGPYNSASNPPWVVIGTPRSFYFLCAAFGSYAVGAPMSVTDTYQAFFGDPDRVQKIGDLYACIVAGNNAFPGGSTPLYINRNHTGTAGALTANLHSPTALSASYLSAGHGFPDPLTGGMTLGDAWSVTQDNDTPTALRGFMPGLLSCWQNIGADDAMLRPGVPFANVTGVSGRATMVCNTSAPKSGAVIVLDEDWGEA